MDDEIIFTGNPVADNFLRKQITDDVGLWALVSYFESKGLLNRKEFLKFLNSEAKCITHAITKVEQSEIE